MAMPWKCTGDERKKERRKECLRELDFLITIFILGFGNLGAGRHLRPEENEKKKFEKCAGKIT